MSVPPPPQGPWQTPHGQPTQGQPYGPPPGQYPGWPPPGPPKKNNALKWALGLVGLIAVIAVAVAVTVVVLHSDSNGSANGSGSGSGSPSNIASAKDTGPVAVITDEPTCSKFGPINDGLANQQRNGWDKRDPSVPATAWSSDQRAQFQAVGTSMRNTADQFVPLAKQTPHRVIRELYEQFIVYARAYADSISTYTAADDQLALVAVNASSTIYYACQAISQGSASTWGPSVPAAPPPSQPTASTDPADPQRFLTSADPICGDLIVLTDRYVANNSEWDSMDSRIPANQWTPDQKAVFDAVKPVMSTYADEIEELGQRSNNATFQDFAILSAQYLRAYVLAIPTYNPTDSFLPATAHSVKSLIYQACKVVGS